MGRFDFFQLLDLEFPWEYNDFERSITQLIEVATTVKYRTNDEVLVSVPLDSVPT